MLIDISPETVDEITVQSLRTAIECTKQIIADLEHEEESLKRYQREDLEYSREILPSLERVFDYFGGNLQ